MSYIYLLRHGRTAWNESGKIQGRTDIALSPQGRAEIQAMELADLWLNLKWYCSPLVRAQQTASLLGAENVEIAAALVETNWGEFEGLSLAEIEHQIVARRLDPATGLDMQPPGGESPRLVAARFQTWLKDTANPDRDMFCVTHKGVIRAALSLATGWDMQASFPQKIDWRLPVSFTIGNDRTISLNAVNVEW